MIIDNGSPKDLTKRLIELCYKNDKRAQIELYNKYAKAMYNVCLNIVYDPVNAEDLMQEAFISAFKNLKSFKAEVSFGAWLKKIVINKCIDFLKQKRVSFESLDTMQDYIDYEVNTNEEDQIILQEKIETIKKTIAQLPEGYRTIMSLYLFEGYDHDEISEILHISSSTSRSQYARAKALLVKKIKDKV